MTSSFDDFERERREYFSDDRNLDDINLDNFELLSAYLDGELTPAEKKSVQDLLDNDPNSKKIYIKLLTMQRQMQNLAIPSSNISPAKLSENVFEQIDKSQRQRKTLVWGGAVVAACLATLSGIVPGINTPALKMVRSPSQSTFSEPMMVAVAVDKPAVRIPKAASSNSQHNGVIER
ncbi:MAG: zf-HC2 domain-containing protein [Pleurocapsa sp.]